MTGVNETNAVVREQARIREALKNAKTKTYKIHSHIHGKQSYREEVYVLRADVLAILKSPTV